MKWVIVTDESYYPTIIVLDNEKHANQIYDGLKNDTFLDWDGQLIKPCEKFNVDMFCVENTSLKTQDWQAIDQLPIAQGMNFL